MRYAQRSFAILAVAFLVIAIQPPRPADAFFEAYASYNGGSFRRAPDDQPLMTKQEQYVWCVASATEAWIDYARLVSGTNNRPLQSDMWWFFDQSHGNWQEGVNIAQITRGGGSTGYPSYTYTRRYHNISQDDGADPYTAAWAMYWNTPNSYHINAYATGSVKTGYDYATHGIAWTLAQYQEPVGVIIGNGGHFVLITYVQTDVSPLSNFWANISYFYYRDPLISQGAYPYTSNKVQAFYSSWSGATGLSQYGYEGTTVKSYPYCGSNGLNCRDEARTGSYAFNAWWGRWVTIERDGSATNADDVFQIQW